MAMDITRAALEAALRAAASQLTDGSGPERGVSAIIQVRGERGLVSLLVPESAATAELAERLGRCLELAETEAKLGLTVLYTGLLTPPESAAQGLRLSPQAWALIRLKPFEGPKVHITHTLREAQKLSETEVMAIGTDMTRVSQLAKHHADGLKDVSAQLSNSGSTDQATVSTAITSLAQELRAFANGLLERTAHQAHEVEQARVWTTDIMRLGQAIADIASSARILTFNARVESARIGEAGKGFAVIAQAIQDLATQIRATNDSVSRLAHNLSSALPRLGQEANGIAEETRKAMKNIDRQLEAVQATLLEARNSAGAALQQGVGDAAELQDHAYAVLEHLQFQDRTSQMMADAIEQVHRVLAFAHLDEVHVDDARLAQVGKLGREMQGSGPLLPAGNVELF
jgi:uncharacterized protein YoxC